MAATNGKVKGEQLVSEIIGRTTSPYPRQYMPYRSTVDRTQIDYAWWSKFRRGKQPGFELGGAFARPILNIQASWVLGSGVDVDTGNDIANERIAQFIADNLDTLLTWYTDGLALGDSYLIVNPDGSLVMAPPDTVDIITDPLDYRTVLAYRITTKLETVTIIDEYRTDGRTVTIQEAGKQPVPIEFMNPLGIIPVIPFHNEREANETNGHPVYEGLLQLFMRYDDLLSKTLDGAEVNGRPILTFFSEDPERDRQANATRTENYIDKDGNAQTEYVVDFEEVYAFWLKEGGDAKFVSPGAYASDAKVLLKNLFYLMLEHSGIPEWAWGGAIASSMASVSAQMPAFVRLIDRWRKALAGPLMDLLAVWYRSVALFEFLPAVADMEISWPEVVNADEALLLNKVRYAHMEAGIMTDVTALRLLDMVDDPEGEVEAGRMENEERQEKQMEMTIAKLEAQPDTTSEDDLQAEAA